MSWNRNLINRRFAGNINVEDAFITGYFYFFLDVKDKVAELIINRANALYKKYNNINGLSDAKKLGTDNYKKLIAATCLNVAPPGGTLNVESLAVMGGVKFGTATNIDYPDTFTTRHVELAGIPVFHFISAWVNLVRDRNAGLSPLGVIETGGKYTKDDFYGAAYYVITKPNGKDIEMAMKFEGLVPLTDPIDKFGHDLATVNVLQHDITWHYDSIWANKKVLEEAKKMIDDKGFKEIEKIHTQCSSGNAGGATKSPTI